MPMPRAREHDRLFGCRRRALLGGLLAVVFALPRGTRAAPADVEAPEPVSGLRWTAPAGCPDAEAVAAKIEGLVGPGSAKAAVDGSVSLVDEGYALALSIGVEGRVESRSVVSTDCVLLSNAAALLVAITIDAVAAAAVLSDQRVLAPEAPGRAAPQANPVVAEPPASPRAVRNSEPRAPVPTPKSQRLPWRHGAEGGIAGGLGVSLVPALTGGLEGYAGWRYGPIRVRALAYHWFGRSRRVDATSGVFAALSGAGLRGCFAPRAGRVEVPLCAGADLGALYGRGVGSAVRPPLSPAGLWVALAVGFGVQVRVGSRFTLDSRLELVATMRRPALHLDFAQGPSEVFRAPPLGFRLLLGASVHSR